MIWEPSAKSARLPWLGSADVRPSAGAAAACASGRARPPFASAGEGQAGPGSQQLHADATERQRRSVRRRRAGTIRLWIPNLCSFVRSTT
jgi:hypothetical protein